MDLMSKRWYNVLNPDDLCEKYGADTFRMYEMFLGPLEQSKPWNTAGITGVHNFLKKAYNLFFNEKEECIVNEEVPSPEELKILHKTIKKIGEDIETLSLNTSISAFMICVNELTKLKCSKKSILEPFLIILSPFAPHFAEELWSVLGNTNTIHDASFPEFNEKFMIEEAFDYPISINGKVKFKINIPLGLNEQEVTDVVLKDEKVIEALGGKDIKKMIIVLGRIVNMVL